MSVRTGVRELVPDVEERQRARTWLLPWADHAGWWRAPVGVVGVLGVIRALLLVVSHRPWFMNDSAEYLLLVDDLYVPRTRPPGVSVFWRADLVLWHSLDSILVAQALLGIGAGLLLFLAAREIGLGTRPAVVVAVLASCAPTVLFFERVLLTESLSYFFAVLTMWLMLVSLRTRSSMAWAVTGLVAALAVLVRSVAALYLPVIGILALALTAGSLLRRIAVTMAFTVAALVPLAGYSFAAFVDSRAITGKGHFGVQFVDGYTYFIATAPLTDCSHPHRPPAIRARVCAIPGFLEGNPDGVMWGPGPVNDALRSAHYIDRNRDLRQLAFESVRQHPLGFLRLVGGRTVRLLSTYDSVYTQDARPWGEFLTRLGFPITGADRTENVWPVLLDVWAVMRLALWAAAVGALVLAPRRWRRGGREIVAVVAPAAVVFVFLGLTNPGARYLLQLEPAGWLAAGWLVMVVVDRRRAKVAP